MLNEFPTYFCKSCEPLFTKPPAHIEEKKCEEDLCSNCNHSPAVCLYQGKPSCFPCRKQAKILPKSQKHHIKTTHRSQNDANKSLSPRKIFEYNNVNNIQSLKHLSPKQKSKGIISLKTQEEEINCKPTNIKQKSMFLTILTNERIQTNSIKISDFLDSIIKKGLDTIKPFCIYKVEEGSYSPKSFHTACDNIPGLLILISFTSGFLLGGYQSSPLNKEKRVNKDENALLFSLFGEKPFFYEIGSNSIKYETDGFGYGVPINLMINLEIIDESFCGLELKYKSPLGGDVKFRIADNFVWSLIVKEVLAFKIG